MAKIHMMQIAYFAKSDFEQPQFCAAMPDDATIDDYEGDGYYVLRDGAIYMYAGTTKLDARDIAGPDAAVI